MAFWWNHLDREYLALSLTQLKTSRKYLTWDASILWVICLWFDCGSSSLKRKMKNWRQFLFGRYQVFSHWDLGWRRVQCSWKCYWIFLICGQITGGSKAYNIYKNLHRDRCWLWISRDDTGNIGWEEGLFASRGIQLEATTIPTISSVWTYI